MRTEAILAALVLAASAFAIPDAEPKYHRKGKIGFCSVPGMFCITKRGEPSNEEVAACGGPGRPCNSIKHAAHGIADVLDSAERFGDDEPSWCHAEGAPCHKASKHIGAIAEKAREHYSHVYAREADAVAEADPKYKRKGKMGFCSVPGMFCITKRDAEAKNYIGCGKGQFCATGDIEHDREAYAAHRGRVGHAGEPGTPWLVARDAEPKYHRKGKIGFCSVPGMFCITKRDAEAEANPRFEGVCGRDAHCAIGPEAIEKVREHPHLKSQLKGCGPEGTPCLVLHKDHDVKNIYSRDAEADPKYHRKGKIGFCSVPGMFCITKRSAEATSTFCPPGVPCISGKDAQTVASIIKANDPDYLRKKCNEPGNECHTLKQLQQVFKRIKNDVQLGEKQKEESGDEHLTRCTKGDAKCSVLSLKHAHDKHHGIAAAVKSEEDCHSGNGYCGAIRRDLEELEVMVERAVAEVEE
ncbi:uncharacterized protein LTR77_002161 [Saxophila tyrrhenica]|uniref:Uncharacterized protein n=1 Tax=Saxophila tyrrhenica TaxID=1690608 RepID=A0AAV9PIE3_9PEZI|nr:hypothetical protein LTR77_002161 [Saxophila tyrrhenica]